MIAVGVVGAMMLVEGCSGGGDGDGGCGECLRWKEAVVFGGCG